MFPYTGFKFEQNWSNMTISLEGHCASVHGLLCLLICSTLWVTDRMIKYCMHKSWLWVIASFQTFKYLHLPWCIYRSSLHQIFPFKILATCKHHLYILHHVKQKDLVLVHYCNHLNSCNMCQDPNYPNEISVWDVVHSKPFYPIWM